MDVWALRQVQITLDGTHDVYNSVKGYVLPKEDPYLRVLNNVDNLLTEGISVSIRLNMDTHNW